MSSTPPPPPTFGSGEKKQPKEFVDPGPYEALHSKAKGIFPQPFEGASMKINKILSPFFQISHNIAINKSAGYSFGSTFVNVNGSDDKCPLLFRGDMSRAGMFNAHIIKIINNNTYRAVFQSHETNIVSQYAVEHKGKDYVASALIVNPDPMERSFVGGFNYLQSLGKRFAVGAELLYHRHPVNIPGKQEAKVSIGGRYTGEKWTFAGTLNPTDAALTLTGCGKINDNFQIAMELDGNYKAQECKVAVGYEYILPECYSTFKGSVDTDLCVKATMEKILLPLPFVISLSAVIDYMTNKSRWGIGLSYD